MSNVLNKITARDLIRRAFITCGIIGSNEKIPDVEATDALDLLNEIIGKFNNEDMFFTGNRQIEIECDGSNYYVLEDLPVDGILSVSYQSDLTFSKLQGLTRDQFLVTKDKNDYVAYYFFDYHFPKSFLYVLKNPTIGKLTIMTNEQIKKINNLDEEIYMPDGWIITLRSNLTLRLAVNYGVSLPDFVANEAVSSKAVIKANNQNLIKRTFDIYYRSPRRGRGIR